MSDKKQKLTQKRLKELLNYDPETGIFTNRVKRSNLSLAGDEAGSIYGYGYITIGINYKKYGAHRLAFLYMDGKLPINQVDHIDQNRQNNKWDNLRHATSSDNQRNRKLMPTNTSGFNGVYWNKSRGKWRASILLSSGSVSLGYYKTHLAACYARHCANQKYGFSKNHGRSL